MTEPIPAPPYEPPSIEDYGTLRDLTRGGLGLLGDGLLNAPLVDAGGIIGGSA